MSPENETTPGAQGVARDGLAAQTAVVFAAALALALLFLRVRSDWAHGVIGGGDAWQNFWNLWHVDRALTTGGRLFFSETVWAPEGASLRLHTLGLTNTLPGAVLSRFVGLPLAYNFLVVFSFGLAAAGFYRLARRLEIGLAGATLGAFVFAFSPQHSARALGHLNLLGIGWIALALEGILVACRDRKDRWLPAAWATLCLVALVYTDWYLAILGALAAVCLGVSELRRAEKGGRPGVIGVLAAIALASLVPVLPFALAAAREGRETPQAHEAAWCSTALTSLVVPSRVLALSDCTRPLTEKNHQNPAEGAGYLGIVALAALGVALADRGARKRIGFAVAAGGLALLFSLGPKPRVFDTLLDVPLPYAWLERVAPALALGGCVNRFQVLAFLPLGLAVGVLADRLWGATIRARALTAALAALLLVEYFPNDPGVSVAPWEPRDPAMTAIARSLASGNVLDLDRGVGGLVHQVRHGRPQTFGYLSRLPAGSWERRLEDPVLGPLLDSSRAAPGFSREVAGELLRHRWNVAFVAAPASGPLFEQARALGFPRFASSAMSAVFAVVGPGPPPLARVEFSEDAGAAARRGFFFEGLHSSEELHLGDVSVVGRWTSAAATVLIPLRPGRYRLQMLAPRPEAAKVELEWNAHRAKVTVAERMWVPLEISPADVGADGVLKLEIRSSVFRPPTDPRDLGVFLASIEPE